MLSSLFRPVSAVCAFTTVNKPCYIISNAQLCDLHVPEHFRTLHESWKCFPCYLYDISPQDILVLKPQKVTYSLYVNLLTIRTKI